MSVPSSKPRTSASRSATANPMRHAPLCMAAGFLALSGACSPPPPQPEVVVAIAPSAPAPPPELAQPFVVAAEGDISLSTWVLDDGLLLTDGHEEAVEPWISIRETGVRLSDAPPPCPGTSARPPRTAWKIGGSFRGGLWLAHHWNNERHQWVSLDSDVYRERNGQWVKVHSAEDRRCFAVWEAPGGCWLGLEGNEGLDALGTTSRVVVDCPVQPPNPFTVRLSEDATGPLQRLGFKGLSDGGVAAVISRGHGWMFAERGGKPPILGRWTRKGDARPSVLPMTEEMSELDFHSSGGPSFMTLLESKDAIVVVGNLSANGPQAGSARTFPYAARCKEACSLIALPAMRAIGKVALLDDGGLIMTGIDEGGRVAVWAEPAEGRFEQLGAIPPLDQAEVSAVFARRRDDVWLVFTSSKSRAAPHTWILHNQKVVAPMHFSG